MSEHRRYLPPPPLSAWVRCLWYWEGAPQGHSQERLLPNGEPSIIFNLCDDPIRIYDAGDLTRFETFGCAVLEGARANCFAIDTCQQERVIGIQFRPGGAFPFFRMPAGEFEGQSNRPVWAAAPKPWPMMPPGSGSRRSSRQARPSMSTMPSAV